MESAGKRASTRALSLERLSAVIASSAGRTLPVTVLVDVAQYSSKVENVRSTMI
jgi:hypothetical protein